MFGDIPLTEALRGLEFVQPKYDSQESVYKAVIDMLDSAISDLGVGSGYGGTGDIMFDGDATAWMRWPMASKRDT